MKTFKEAYIYHLPLLRQCCDLARLCWTGPRWPAFVEDETVSHAAPQFRQDEEEEETLHSSLASKAV